MWNSGGGGYEQGGYGDQGGGYLQSPGQFASPGGSQGEKRRSSNRAQNIMPVTTAQIMSVEQMDDRFYIDNIELHQITLVGLVKSVNETATRLDYFIDDMTGPPMEVKHFVDNDDNTPDAERTQAMRENTYVRVTGNVRAFNNKKNIVAFKISPVLDPNEITTHMLEVIHSHISLTKASNNMLAGGGSTYSGAAPMSTATSFTPDQGLTQTQNQVHMVIKSCSDEQGLSVSYICTKLRGIPAKEIKDAVDFLSSEGHIYSTIDDDHYKSTDSA